MDFYTITDHVQRFEIAVLLGVAIVLLLIAVRVNMVTKGRKGGGGAGD